MQARYRRIVQRKVAIRAAAYAERGAADGTVGAELRLARTRMGDRLSTTCASCVTKCEALQFLQFARKITSRDNGKAGRIGDDAPEGRREEDFISFTRGDPPSLLAFSQNALDVVLGAGR